MEDNEKLLSGVFMTANDDCSNGCEVSLELGESGSGISSLFISVLDCGGRLLDTLEELQLLKQL